MSDLVYSIMMNAKNETQEEGYYFITYSYIAESGRTLNEMAAIDVEPLEWISYRREKEIEKNYCIIFTEKVSKEKWERFKDRIEP